MKLQLSALLLVFALAIAGTSSGRAQGAKKRTYFQNWLEQDVAYIISPEEKTAYERLDSDVARTYFIATFWQRRDPTPDTFENEFHIEHYLRFAFANQHYRTTKPGWTTDRGCVYILWGPADRIERTSKVDGTPSTEDWHYRYLDGIGSNIQLQFFYDTESRDFQLFSHEGKTCLQFFAAGAEAFSGSWTGGRTPPKTTRKRQFPELRDMVLSKLRHNEVPVRVSSNVLKVTDASWLVSFAVRLPGGEPCTTGSEAGCGRFEFLGMIVQSDKRIAQTLEAKLPAKEPSDPILSHGGLSKQFPWDFSAVLPAGAYVLRYGIRDTITNRTSIGSHAFVVP
jgi:GWxTD domain-containing protein